MKAMATMTMWIMSQGSGLVLALFPPSGDNPLPLLSTLDCQPPQIPPYSYCLYVYTLFLSFLAFSPGALCTSEKVRHYLIIVRRGIGASPNNETNTYFTQLKFRNLLWGLGGIALLVSVSIGKFQNYSMSRLGWKGKSDTIWVEQQGQSDKAGWSNNLELLRPEHCCRIRESLRRHYRAGQRSSDLIRDGQAK